MVVLGRPPHRGRRASGADGRRCASPSCTPRWSPASRPEPAPPGALGPPGRGRRGLPPRRPRPGATPTWWRDRLADAPEPVRLARTDAAARARDAAPGRRADPPSLDARLRAAAHHRPARRPSGVVTAAVAAYLHRVTGAHDLVLGLPVTARSGPQHADAAGHARQHRAAAAARCGPTPRLGDLVDDVGRELQKAALRQRYRGEDLCRDLRVPGGILGLIGPSVNYMAFDYGLRFAGAPGHGPARCAAGPVDDLAFAVYDRGDGTPHGASTSRPTPPATAPTRSTPTSTGSCAVLDAVADAAPRPPSPVAALDLSPPRPSAAAVLGRRAGDGPDARRAHAARRVRGPGRPRRPTRWPSSTATRTLTYARARRRRQPAGPRAGGPRRRPGRRGGAGAAAHRRRGRGRAGRAQGGRRPPADRPRPPRAPGSPPCWPTPGRRWCSPRRALAGRVAPAAADRAVPMLVLDDPATAAEAAAAPAAGWAPATPPAARRRLRHLHVGLDRAAQGRRRHRTRASPAWCAPRSRASASGRPAGCCSSRRPASTSPCSSWSWRCTPGAALVVTPSELRTAGPELLDHLRRHDVTYFAFPPSLVAAFGDLELPAGRHAADRVREGVRRRSWPAGPRSSTSSPATG